MNDIRYYFGFIIFFIGEQNFIFIQIYYLYTVRIFKIQFNKKMTSLMKAYEEIRLGAAKVAPFL